MKSTVVPALLTRGLYARLAFNLVVFLVVIGAGASETNELELQQLRSQISALIVQRRDDFSKLETIARNSLNKDAEIDELRNEIRDVKMELDSMKVSAAKSWPAAAGGADGNRMKNEQLTLEWLSNSISEIRTEVAEMLKSFNSTATLQQQQRQAFTTDVSILQNDVVSLRHNVEHLKADSAKCNAKLAAFTQDVDALKQSTFDVAAKVVNFTQQIRALSAVAAAYDWSSVAKRLKKKQHLAIFKKMIVLNENPLKMQVFTSARRGRAYGRHRRRRRQRCHDRDHQNEEKRERDQRRSGGGASTASTSASTSELHLSKNQQYNDFLSSVKGSVEAEAEFAGDVAAAITSLKKRVERLEHLTVEEEGNALRSKEKDKLRSSMLELLESVENIEAKFDNVTPVLKKEISKMEFSLAQIVANVSIARQHQENDRISLTTVADEVSKTQLKFTHYEHKLSVIEEGLGNVLASFNSTWSNCQENFEQLWWSPTLKPELGDGGGVDLTEKQREPPAVPTPSEYIPNTLSELLLLRNQYADFVRRLPKDCNQVDGGSGLYLISVDLSTPILVFCEKKILDNVDVDKSGGDGDGDGDGDGHNATAKTYSSNRSNVNVDGYIVIQRRINGQTDFNKSWQEYARGFGNLQNEFWLGNELIRRLTRNNDTKLRIELEDVAGRRWYAEYETFSVASRQQQYALYVDGFSGNATDALQHHNGMRFSTKDSDHDTSDTNCAAEYECGWWYSRCQQTNLNAQYNSGFTWFDFARNERIVLSSTKMMLAKKRKA